MHTSFPDRLSTYLVLGVSGSMMATSSSEAVVVSINLANVNGVDITGLNAQNAGAGSEVVINDWLGAGTGQLTIGRYLDFLTTRHLGFRGGSTGGSTLEFAQNGLAGIDPRNFSLGSTIDGSALFTTYDPSRFLQFDYVFPTGPVYQRAPNFGPGSFMGFRFGSGGNFNYGYLEVTWDPIFDAFEVLSGAYESTVNTAILAGAGAPPVIPLPAASLLALMALGGNSFRRSRARAA